MVIPPASNSRIMLTGYLLLAATLLETVALDSLAHGPDEFQSREREMENGTVAELSYEELMRRVKSERRR